MSMWARDGLSWLSLWTPVVLMENNLLTWKWMACTALLAYGTMQLDGCPRGNSGLLPRAIYIWISSHFHFHLETGTEPIVLMKNNIFIMIISTFKKKKCIINFRTLSYSYMVRRNQCLNKFNCYKVAGAKEFCPSFLWAASVSYSVVLKALPGKRSVHISTLSMQLKLEKVP